MTDVALAYRHEASHLNGGYILPSSGTGYLPCIHGCCLDKKSTE
jgi:hypothetical protein